MKDHKSNDGVGSDLRVQRLLRVLGAVDVLVAGRALIARADQNGVAGDAQLHKLQIGVVDILQRVPAFACAHLPVCE